MKVERKQDLRVYLLMPLNRCVCCANCKAFAPKICYIQHAPDCPTVTEDPAPKKALMKAEAGAEKSWEAFKP